MKNSPILKRAQGESCKVAVLGYGVSNRPLVEWLCRGSVFGAKKNSSAPPFFVCPRKKVNADAPLSCRFLLTRRQFCDRMVKTKSPVLSGNHL